MRRPLKEQKRNPALAQGVIGFFIAEAGNGKHAADLERQRILDRPALEIGQVVRKKQAHGIILLLGIAQHAGVKIGIGCLLEGGQQQRDGSGFAAPQGAGLFIDGIAHGARGFLDKADLFIADAAALVENV